MKNLYKINCKNKIKNKNVMIIRNINKIYYNKRIKKESSDLKGKWITFYVPIVANCLYTIKGCIIGKRKLTTIDHSIITKAIISKESITFNVPMCKTSILSK